MSQSAETTDFDRIGKLRRLADSPTFLSDFGGFIALQRIEMSAISSQALTEDRIRQAAHLGAHYTALFAWAVTQEEWPDHIDPPEAYFDWLVEWVKDGPSWELPDGTNAREYLGMTDG